ncbi:MAG: site-specific integrase [Bacteroidetes bacterium]|nr:site-specific integrase [Bacteroidota bacterium]
MKTIKVITKGKSTKADGTTPIYFQFSYDRTKRTLLNTGKSVEPAYWDGEKGRVKRSHPNAEAINKFVNTLKLRLETIIDDAILNKVDATIPFVIEKFHTEVLTETPKGYGFYEVFDRYVDTARSRVSAGLITDYNALKRHLMEFEAFSKTKVTFTTITKAETYDNFNDYLRINAKNANGGSGLKPNSVGKQDKNLKTFLNNCMRREIIPFIDLSFMKKMGEKTFNVYLEEEELDTLIKFDLSNKPEKEIIRDLFMIGCETGLRFSDYSRLTKDHLSDKMIRITTLKTQDRVVIPISERLRTVLSKYEDYGVFQITNQYFNRQIKEIMKLAGFTSQVVVPAKKGTKTTEAVYEKWEMIASHTCRRSFCTNQFLRGVPPILIRKISGHKTEKAFLEYIKVDQELGAKEMIKYWDLSANIPIQAQ